MKKYFISFGAGILILIIAYFTSSLILSLKEKEEISLTETEKLVSVVIVNNSINPVEITSDGRVQSLNKIDIFSEVQGKINFNDNDWTDLSNQDLNPYNISKTKLEYLFLSDCRKTISKTN